ncbi:aspartate kinase [Arachidicoccus soli]|uniref:Aspartokinase n=1 Tax=Arachidicoccus soli TaxID=2341117 RepID=A0A386HME3_9BACT|nr:aspartate kinase [Arachidicoccus soli]AYD46913.1 aspartate kinase [Arachidicoccus soli]
MKVMKFGGTSVGKPERMHQVAELVTKSKESKIVVLSALSGTTNALVMISEELANGKKDKAKQHIDDLEKHYHEFIQNLLKSKTLRQKADAIIKEHFEFLNIILRISFSDALNKDILAQGELMSTKLFSLYLEEIKVDHLLLPALEFMRIDANDEPDLKSIKSSLSALLKKHSDKKIFVTQGYICKNIRGEVDNLKRGGSDYTASLIAAAIEASVCEIWTDIDGMHNNDPRIVNHTEPIEALSFDEAAELAYFGAKILHPTCIWPAQKSHVPVKLLNTMQPDAKGTTIQDKVETKGAKAVAAKDGIIAIKIKSSRMLLAYGFLRKVFEVFEKYRTPIDMITTSEVAISLTIDSTDHLKHIIKELEPFGTVEIDKNQSIISIVGNCVVEQKDVLLKIFKTIHHIPIRMISYGGSRHNISFLIPGKNKNEMLQIINEGVFGM